MNGNFKIIIKYFFLLIIIWGCFTVSASTTDGTIDINNKTSLLCLNDSCSSTSQVNFLTTNGNPVHITDSGLTGNVWSETMGWVNLNPLNGGVTNTSSGVLGGYAWGENSGWINFNPTNGGVTITTQGEFDGFAWSENYGWIKFDCEVVNACVKTDWRPESVRGSRSSSGSFILPINTIIQPITPPIIPSIILPIDIDTDGDSFSDKKEKESGTDSNDPLDKPIDQDNDGVSDKWEQENLGGLDEDLKKDIDGDGLNSIEEYNNNTDPNNPDSDYDGFTDGEELNNYYTDSNNRNFDNNRLKDEKEVNIKNTNSNNLDSDFFTINNIFKLLGLKEGGIYNIGLFLLIIFVIYIILFIFKKTIFKDK